MNENMQYGMNMPPLRRARQIDNGEIPPRWRAALKIQRAERLRAAINKVEQLRAERDIWVMPPSESVNDAEAAAAAEAEHAIGAAARSYRARSRRGRSRRRRSRRGKSRRGRSRRGKSRRGRSHRRRSCKRRV